MTKIVASILLYGRDTFDNNTDRKFLIWPLEPIKLSYKLNNFRF